MMQSALSWQQLPNECWEQTLCVCEVTWIEFPVGKIWVKYRGVKNRSFKYLNCVLTSLVSCHIDTCVETLLLTMVLRTAHVRLTVILAELSWARSRCTIQWWGWGDGADGLSDSFVSAAAWVSDWLTHDAESNWQCWDAVIPAAAAAPVDRLTDRQTDWREL